MRLFISLPNPTNAVWIETPVGFLFASKSFFANSPIQSHELPVPPPESPPVQLKPEPLSAKAVRIIVVERAVVLLFAAPSDKTYTP